MIHLAVVHTPAHRSICLPDENFCRCPCWGWRPDETRFQQFFKAYLLFIFETSWSWSHSLLDRGSTSSVDLMLNKSTVAKIQLMACKSSLTLNKDPHQKIACGWNADAHCNVVERLKVLWDLLGLFRDVFFCGDVAWLFCFSCYTARLWLIQRFDFDLPNGSKTASWHPWGWSGSSGTWPTISCSGGTTSGFGLTITTCWTLTGHHVTSQATQVFLTIKPFRELTTRSWASSKSEPRNKLSGIEATYIGHWNSSSKADPKMLGAAWFSTALLSSDAAPWTGIGRPSSLATWLSCLPPVTGSPAPALASSWSRVIERVTGLLIGQQVRSMVTSVVCDLPKRIPMFLYKSYDEFSWGTYYVRGW